MLTLKNLSQYESSFPKVAHLVAAHAHLHKYLTRTPFQIKGEEGEVCRFAEIVGIHSPGKTFPSLLGPAFDLAYPSYEQRFCIGIMISRFLAADATPLSSTNPNHDNLKFHSPNGLDTEGPYLEDCPTCEIVTALAVVESYHGPANISIPKIEEITQKVWDDAEREILLSTGEQKKISSTLRGISYYKEPVRRIILNIHDPANWEPSAWRITQG